MDPQIVFEFGSVKKGVGVKEACIQKWVNLATIIIAIFGAALIEYRGRNKVDGVSCGPSG